MSADPRAALAQFVNALERHLELAATGRGADDPRMDEVTEALADAFDTYDEALYDNYRTSTPFFLPAEDDDYDGEDDLDEPEDDLEEEDVDEEDDDEPYSGFGDDDFDFDDDEEEASDEEE